jgi:signal recognition particle GTPase
LRSEKVFEKLENVKKVYLMLGKTGMGKSTTILYIAGEVMESQKKNGLSHIDAQRPLKKAYNFELN